VPPLVRWPCCSAAEHAAALRPPNGSPFFADHPWSHLLQRFRKLQLKPRPQLICIKAGTRRCIHTYTMSKDVTPTTNEVICPVCGRPMTLLHTIRRAFGENLNVFKCKPWVFNDRARKLDNPAQIKVARLKASLDLPSGDIFEGQKAGCRRHRRSMDATCPAAYPWRV
jgi:hypothetical protein